MTPHHFGSELAHKVHAFEDAIDKALAAGADLTSTAVMGRMQHKLSAIAGGSSLAPILSAQVSLGQARDQIVEAHVRLADAALKERINWRTHMGGPVHKPEDGVEPARNSVAPLRIAS